MISFRLGTLPISVRPVFFLTAVFLGLVGFRQPASLAIWVAVVFVSVLAHELGHALTARRYGAEAEIELFALGGLTKWHRDPPVSAGGRVVIAAAGSAVGITIGLVVLALFGDDLRSFSPILGTALFDLIWVNLGWGILNWLPIRMLDGGHILGGVLEIWFPKNHARIADVVFLASAVALIGIAIYLQLFWLAFLFALFGFSGQSSRAKAVRRDDDLQARLVTARQALSSGEYETAEREARSLLRALSSADAQTTASRILVRALLSQGRVSEAAQLIESPPDGFHPGPADTGRVLLASGHLKPAIEMLSVAVAAGNTDALPVLVDAYGQAGTFTEAVAFFEQVAPEALRPEPLRALATEADRAGWSTDAAELRRLADWLPISQTEPPAPYPSSE
ncbi:MAG: site-2 protease family protein [Acidimicrobiia bacterium]